MELIVAASAGIISGRGNNKFDPTATIKRDEAVIMIDRALEYNWIYRKEVKLPFTDQDLAYDKKGITKCLRIRNRKR